MFALLFRMEPYKGIKEVEGIFESDFASIQEEQYEIFNLHRTHISDSKASIQLKRYN